MTAYKLFVLAAVMAVGIGCNPNLAWDGDKTYAPPKSAELQVERVGINDEVDILQPGATPVVTHTILNNSSRSASAGYTVNETVIQWIFVATTGSAGFVASLAHPRISQEVLAFRVVVPVKLPALLSRPLSEVVLQHVPLAARRVSLRAFV